MSTLTAEFIGYMPQYPVEIGGKTYSNDVIAFHMDGWNGNPGPQDVIQGMTAIAQVLNDGHVTADELGDMLELLCPHLADHPEFGLILKLADEAIRAVKGDGKITAGEGLAILIPLLSHGAPAAALGNLAHSVASGVLKRLSGLLPWQKEKEPEPTAQPAGPAQQVLHGLAESIQDATGLPVHVEETPTALSAAEPFIHATSPIQQVESLAAETVETLAETVTEKAEEFVENIAGPVAEFFPVRKKKGGKN